MIPLYWFRKYENFGDRLSEIIVRSLSGHPVRFTEAGPKLLAVGSIAHFAVCGDHLWGTGVREETHRPEPSVTIHAVRGPESRRFFLAHDVECPAVYGDPALLMPRYYTPRVVRKQGRVVLPHYRDRRLTGAAGEQLSVQDDPFRLIDRIASAEILVTSSLHGLIIADAYGIPAVLLRSSDQAGIEPDFKFIDYFHSTNRENGTVWDVSVGEASLRPLPPPELPDLKQLAEAFPHDVFTTTGNA